MTWIKFTLWLLGIYTSYYAALIVWDYLRTKGGDIGNDKLELTFAEDIEPFKSYVDESIPNGNQSSVVFSGGVSLKQMFNLAREESVEYIKAVSY